jgi:hypothetical protein
LRGIAKKQHDRMLKVVSRWLTAHPPLPSQRQAAAFLHPGKALMTEERIIARAIQ